VWNLLSTIGAFILAFGVLTFVINLIVSWRTGEDAPDNPWDADTLEWATSTPMPQYGFRWLPIVRGRHPLWDQDDFSEGSEKQKRVVEALAHYPVDWRSQLATSAIDAEPEEVFRVAAWSIAPLVVALGLMAMSFFLIFKLVIPAVVSLIVGVLGLLIWHGQDYAVITRHTQEDEAFELETGVPIRAEGSQGVTRGTMLLTCVTIFTAVATLIFSYLYLRIDVPQWPPMDVPLPDPVLPGIALVGLFVGGGAAFWSARGVRRDAIQPVRTGLAVASLAGLIYAVLYGWDLLRVPFTPSSHAYGSLYFALTVSMILVVLAGVAASAVSLFWIVRANDRAASLFNVRALAIYWYFLAGLGALVFLIVTVLPYII
jgi:heme/copper-type cytochrome/quinol oxidase subunit 3